MSEHHDTHSVHFEAPDPADNSADTRAALALIVIAVAAALYFIADITPAELF